VWSGLRTFVVEDAPDPVLINLKGTHLRPEYPNYAGSVVPFRLGPHLLNLKGTPTAKPFPYPGPLVGGCA